MKHFFYLTIALSLVCSFAFSQGDTRYDITGFEGVDYDWAYTGNSVVYSQIEWSDFQGGATPKEGEQALAFEYDNSIGGTWQGVTLNLPEPVDLTGATEIHMWVFVVPELTTGTFSVRLDLPGGIGLGTRYINEDQWGKWVDVSWRIDHIASAQRLSSVGYLGGFISAANDTDKGFCYIDNVYGLHPASAPSEYDEIMLWGFNDEDPNTGEPVGWTVDAGPGVLLGFGEVEPSEGSNYGEIQLGSGWTSEIKTTDAFSDYDNWPSVLEVMADVRVAQDMSGGWVNFQLILQSNQNDSDQYGENGIFGAKDDWLTVVWCVDMSKHADAFNPDVPDRWFQLAFSTNQDAQDAGKYVYVDNVRIVVPKTDANVANWTLF